MSRMDKYLDEEEMNETPQEEVVLSRVNKNQVMYDDVYFNRTRLAVDEALDEDEVKEEVKEEELPPVEEVYEKKSYNVNEYLEKAHENKSPDNLKRDIDDTAFKEQEDEIRKLIDSINEKEENEDFFKDLKGDDDEKTVGARYKTDEFNNSIYETIKGDKTRDNAILNRALSDETVLDLEKEEDEKMDHTFEKIMIEDEEMGKKKNTLPIIIFCILLFTLILVVAIILLFK